MKIYTKTGDKGETALFSGTRIPKNSLYVETYGTVDELNSFLGLALLKISTKEERFTEFLKNLQNTLFDLGADLATPLDYKKSISRIEQNDITTLEKEIDFMENCLTPLKTFIIPGGSEGASLLHICRTVCRRAERNCYSLLQENKINSNALIFLNRLSDFFFVSARYENHLRGIDEPHWQSLRSKS